jgi:hypothetical protein
MTISQFTQLVIIKYKGQSLKSNQFTSSVYNSTTFLVIFSNNLTDGSLNELALSFSFAPGSITDQYGNILTTVTVT